MKPRIPRYRWEWGGSALTRRELRLPLDCGHSHYRFRGLLDCLMRAPWTEVPEARQWLVCRISTDGSKTWHPLAQADWDVLARAMFPHLSPPHLPPAPRPGRLLEAPPAPPTPPVTAPTAGV